MTPHLAVEAIDLVKQFDDNTAVDGVSFVVPQGTVLGMLGPNGAGKTTTVRMLTTLSQPTSGTGRVAGYDVVKEPAMVRRSMGLTGQAATVDELLTARENLRLIGRLSGMPKGEIGPKGDALLERFSLTDAGDRVVKQYSGGMRRRLDLAVSLIAAPPVLFLDEPTTGLDPHSRNELWDVLRGLVKDGTTLVLTTQYLEEADRARGRHHRHRQGQGHRRRDADAAQGRRPAAPASYSRSPTPPTSRLPRSWCGAASTDVYVEPGARRVTAQAGGLTDMTRIADALADSGIEIDDLGLTRPSLDDVFLSLTGHRAEEEHGRPGRPPIPMPRRKGRSDDDPRPRRGQTDRPHIQPLSLAASSARWCVAT